MIRLGYPCINTELRKKGFTNSTCRKSTFQREGLNKISSLILSNLDVLNRTLEWNLENDITFFRVSSDLFPWMDFYEYEELPEFESIRDSCEYIGLVCKENDIRLTFHPGPYNVLCSPSDAVVQKTIKTLDRHSQIFDLMGFEPSHYNAINIHVGGAYGDKKSSLESWARNFELLGESTKKRLTIENDDKPSMYNVEDLMELNSMCGVPVCFDYFHHRFHPGNLNEKEALEQAISTWNVRPVTHWSESRREEFQKLVTDVIDKHGLDIEEWPTFKAYYEEFSKIKYQAHSNMVEGNINDYGHDIDVMLEAKSKEKALFGINDPKYRENCVLESLGINIY